MNAVVTNTNPVIICTSESIEKLREHMQNEMIENCDNFEAKKMLRDFDFSKGGCDIHSLGWGKDCYISPERGMVGDKRWDIVPEIHIIDIDNDPYGRT